MTSTSSTGAERAGPGASVGANPSTAPPATASSAGSAGADLKPFFFGGIASCVAETVTFPIDTAKTRLQLQGKV